MATEDDSKRKVHEVSSKKTLGGQFSTGAIIGAVYWGIVYLYIRQFIGLQTMLGLEGVYFNIIAVSIWIVFLELSTELLPNFVARKLCHAGCGFGMLLLDSTDLRARLFVYFVSVSSIAMTWGLSPLPKFRFSDARDVGITIYLIGVSTWFYLQQPVAVLMPMFFADPAGAVVGKYCSHYFKEFNPAWYEKKTLAGSAAVFVVTLLTLGYPCSTFTKIAIGVSCVLAEAFGGTYDNLTLGAIVLLGWYFSSPGK